MHHLRDSLIGEALLLRQECALVRLRASSRPQTCPCSPQPLPSQLAPRPHACAISGAGRALLPSSGLSLPSSGSAVRTLPGPAPAGGQVSGPLGRHRFHRPAGGALTRLVEASPPSSAFTLFPSWVIRPGDPAFPTASPRGRGHLPRLHWATVPISLQLFSFASPVLATSNAKVLLIAPVSSFLYLPEVVGFYNLKAFFWMARLSHLAKVYNETFQPRLVLWLRNPVPCSTCCLPRSAFAEIFVC